MYRQGLNQVASDHDHQPANTSLHLGSCEHGTAAKPASARAQHEQSTAVVACQIYCALG